MKKFNFKKLKPHITRRYKKVSELSGVPLKLVSTVGATESQHGTDKRVEALGNTEGLFHVTRDGAIDGLVELFGNKDKSAKKLRSMSKNEARKWLLENKDVQDKAAAGYLKKSYVKAKGDPKLTYGYYNAGAYAKKFNSMAMENS